jgi:AAA+ superfamily predicted ATPase
MLDLRRYAVCAPEMRAKLVALLGREARLAGLALVVDGTEAERDGAVPLAINELIATLGATLFVMSNERWPANDDVAVVRTSRPTRLEQRSLWRTALATHANSVNGEIDAITQQFDFGTDAIAEVVLRAARRGGEITGRSLWATCREQTGAALDEMARRIVPSYGWDDIVVSEDVRTQLREVSAQVRQRSRVYETWGFGAQLGRGRGITALFAGPTGTGKTMAAEIIAADLELDLYRIDLAGVVSKYIGETEKNLRRVFDAAERSGAILFFDEADALFGTRTEVRDSHDRYANLEINYLLQRMEDYSGLAILATNRRSALDAAFLRRLRFVIDFPFPAADDRRRIWGRVFPVQADIDALELAFLSNLDLSGGNIRSIAVNAAFLAAADGTPICMTHLVRSAAREYVKLSKPIGVAEFGPYYTMVRR